VVNIESKRSKSKKTAKDMEEDDREIYLPTGNWEPDVEIC